MSSMHTSPHVLQFCENPRGTEDEGHQMSLISPFAAYLAGQECLWHSLIGTCPSLQTCRGDNHGDAGHQHPEKDRERGPAQQDDINT